MDAVVRLAIVAGLGLVVWGAAVALRAYFSGGELPSKFDHGDVGADPSRPLIVEFTSPFCHECKTILPTLKAASVVYSSEFALVDAKERPDLTQKYGVRATPTVLVVEAGGSVRAAWLGSPPEEALERALVGTASARVA